jgi:hypothetical protein
MAELLSKDNVVPQTHRTPENSRTGYAFSSVHYKTPHGSSEIQVVTPDMVYANDREKKAREILGNSVVDSIKRHTNQVAGESHLFYEEYRLLAPDSPKAIKIATEAKKYHQSIRDAYRLAKAEEA